MIAFHPIAGTKWRLVAVLLAAGTVGARALAGVSTLDLDGDQMRRLGIEFSSPQASTALTVASAPAEIVIPPVQQSVVSTPVNGLVAALHDAEGDTVAAGQPIADILSAEYMDMQVATSMRSQPNGLRPLSWSAMRGCMPTESSPIAACRRRALQRSRLRSRCRRRTSNCR